MSRRRRARIPPGLCQLPSARRSAPVAKPPDPELPTRPADALQQVARVADAREVVVISTPTEATCRRQRLALVLEDDPGFRAVLAELLTDEGLEYRVCHTYPELRAAADESHVQVIVADFWGSSYLQPTAVEREEIRDLGRRAPTILLTGRSWAHHESADGLGVVCLLLKPVDLDRLVEQVRHCLELARQCTGGG